MPDMLALLGLGAWSPGPLGRWTLSVLHLICACGVTAHVLLRKRDVAAAVGWIGLAWLSPFLGALLYYMLGINRVRRQALRVRADVRASRGALRDPGASGITGHLAPLERAVARITLREIERGNALTMLDNGDAAYPRMLEVIAGARASVGLSSYIFRDDAAGRPFIDALIAAQARGIAVRVLIDGIGGGYFRSAAYTRLRAAGVPAARFMHSALPWRMPFLNLRTHKKILVVDGETGFTGGLNIGAENVIASHPKDPVRDNHFLVRGPVVGQLAVAFAEDWLFASGEQLDGPAWFPDTIPPAGQADARVITSGPDQDLDKIELIVFQAIASATRSVRIMTPYFLPDDRLITALALASMRGVAVDVVIPEHGDHILVDWAVRPEVAPLLDAGVRVWLNPPPFQHSKLLAIDGAWCVIGSANWDMRSFRLNFELTLEVYHDDLAAEVERAIDRRMTRQLTQADLDARALPVRLRDAAARLLLPYL
jgi:cardiolipin synthase